MAKNLITPVFKASFVHLNKPRSGDPNNPDGPKKYSLSVVLDLSDPTHAKFVEELDKVAKATAKEKFGGKLPKKLKLPLRDGEHARQREHASHLREPEFSDHGDQVAANARLILQSELDRHSRQ